jgi:hypothetical protein
MVVLLISLYYQKNLRRYGLNCSIVYQRNVSVPVMRKDFGHQDEV